ncbi:hypothetical protein TNIN_154101 [Trichonephila inaurata madagascariensis]|uniref:Uncharacterized protein n=1 Tax=Trichonephila inaurata madagascariensis TaxID=2747483 RepID=A0A8X6XYE7_9ARAC|nr:hypothetical protein TNIN_154101 [Trichonephila inaurata madagascariensis]
MHLTRQKASFTIPLPYTNRKFPGLAISEICFGFFCCHGTDLHRSPLGPFASGLIPDLLAQSRVLSFIGNNIWTLCLHWNSESEISKTWLIGLVIAIF